MNPASVDSQDNSCSGSRTAADSMIEIERGQIHLWFVFFDDLRDQLLLSEYRKLLSAGEREQESRFLFDRDKHRYLVTRALLRLVLSKYADLAPREWTFATNPYGRPEVANDSAEGRKIAFNISHTNSLIVLGIAQDRAIGVDTENLRAGRDSVDLANRYFAADEVAALRVLSREQQQRRFVEYWTLKESYIKARGMGLSIPLDQFSFHFSQNGRLQMDIAAAQSDSPSRWQFWQFQPAPQYLVAVCAERVPTQLTRLSMKKIVPLVGDETVEYPFLRMSDRS
jgi:4'-phosphopantetheinyl transferase